MDVQFSIPLGIRDLLEHKSGALWGWLYSSPPVSRHIPPEIFAEVTPFQVHAKLGHFNSLIWVMDMATGQPVADADIILYKDTLGALNGPADNEIAARTNADGIAILPGTESFDPDLIRYSGFWEEDKTRFFVQVSPTSATGG
jgi:hypothetical protein